MIEREVGEYYERTSHPYHLTSELRDDGLIDPIDTRNTLGHGALGSAQRTVRADPRRRAANLTDETPKERRCLTRSSTRSATGSPG